MACVGTQQINRFTEINLRRSTHFHVVWPHNDMIASLKYIHKHALNANPSSVSDTLHGTASHAEPLPITHLTDRRGEKQIQRCVNNYYLYPGFCRLAKISYEKFACARHVNISLLCTREVSNRILAQRCETRSANNVQCLFVQNKFSPLKELFLRDKKEKSLTYLLAPIALRLNSLFLAFCL